MLNMERGSVSCLERHWLSDADNLRDGADWRKYRLDWSVLPRAPDKCESRLIVSQLTVCGFTMWRVNGWPAEKCRVSHSERSGRWSIIGLYWYFIIWYFHSNHNYV